jgi:hypothetical protein
MNFTSLYYFYSRSTNILYENLLYFTRTILSPIDRSLLKILISLFAFDISFNSSIQSKSPNMLFSSSVVQQFIILNCVAITSSVVSFLAVRSTYRGRSDIADTAYPSSNIFYVLSCDFGLYFHAYTELTSSHFGALDRRSRI